MQKLVRNVLIFVVLMGLLVGCGNNERAGLPALYICVGYGEQATGGYSITVKELYLTDNAIYVDTNLKGPSPEELQNPVKSYPYIVLKTENMDKTVVFE